MTKLRADVQAFGGREIDPSIARHLVAARYADPFPSVTMVHYDAADIIVHPERLPSPVAEPAISFAFVVYLGFDEADQAEAYCSALPSDVEGWTAEGLLASDEERIGQVRQFSVGVGERVGDALVVRVRVVPPRAWTAEPVWHRLAGLLPEAERRLAMLTASSTARRISRNWMRSRWTVFFEPESPPQPVPVWVAPDGTTLTSTDLDRD
jgi:hypothetical protein